MKLLTPAELEEIKRRGDNFRDCTRYTDELALHGHIAALQYELAAIRAAVDAEFDDGKSVKTGDLLDDFAEFVRHHAEVEIERNALRKQVEEWKAPTPQLQGTFPIVLYFGSDADREEFVALVRQAKPNFTMKNL